MRPPASVTCVLALVLLGIGCVDPAEALGTASGSSQSASASSTTTESESGEVSETETETGEAPGDGDGDGDGDPAGDGDGDLSGDGDGDEPQESCWDAPQECLDFIDCIGVVTPDQLGAVEALYGEGGSCWCNNTEEGAEDKAQDCYEACIIQHNEAIESFPTANQCHSSYCPLEELNADQPYGKPENGACPNWGNSPQLVLDNPFDLPGSVCAPKCSGIANYCPGHNQTAADGTCFLTVGDSNYCVNRCWVDHTIVGGTQCQCGATCQPYGNPDGEGNLRGICTF